MVEVWSGLALDGVGLAAALGAAVAFAVYMLSAEHGVRRRDTLSLTFYGFLFSALFWAFVQPWWSFPVHDVSGRVSLLGHLAGTRVPVWALVAWLLVLGTIVPFRLMIGALRHVPATRAGIVAMIEPVVATVIAWAWLGETLGAVQLVGAAIVLASILLAQSVR